ncbi:MAG: cell division protein FtsW [Elusimicrobia bacterium]|nr:MAG: cell division protein FtsW [Elusimicrobiota bacterium]KAF0155872.1 MAG: cell division protein FtsW [Elusimicrobiota bacterium]
MRRRYSAARGGGSGLFSGLFTSRSLRYADYHFLIAVAALLMIGLVSLYSASAIYAENKGLPSFFYLKRQLIWTFAGLGAMWLAMNLELEKFRRFIKPLMILTLALLVVTLFMPPIANVRRWIPLGFMNLQVSEFAKLAVVLYLADYFDKNISRMLKDWRQLIKPLTVTLLALLLIGIQPDLGTPALIFAVALMMLFCSGVRLRYILAPLGVGLLIFVAEMLRKSYRLDRLKNFLSPWDDASGTGYQLVQSLLAVGSGGWFGVGLGASKLKLMYLPEPHTDFIFPVVAEELGLFGALLIAGLFGYLLLRGLRLARNATSFFSAIAASGMVLIICLQAFFNMAMTLGLTPTKGIPLPFFSYGGSSMITMLLAAGFVLNVSAHRKASL